jgi:hypothetical protein
MSATDYIPGYDEDAGKTETAVRAGGAATGAYAGAAAGAIVVGALALTGVGAPIAAGAGTPIITATTWLGAEVGGYAGGVAYRNAKSAGSFFSRKARDIGRWLRGRRKKKKKKKTWEQFFTFQVMLVALIDSMEAGKPTFRPYGTSARRALHERNRMELFGPELGRVFDPDKIYRHLFVQYRKIHIHARNASISFSKEEKFMLALRSVALFIQEDSGIIQNWSAFGQGDMVKVRADARAAEIARAQSQRVPDSPISSIPGLIIRHRRDNLPRWYKDPLVWGAVATTVGGAGAVAWYAARRL